MGPDIFDVQVPGEAMIESALIQAADGNKRVIVFFGANWCPWCRRLHDAFTKEPLVTELLRRHFVLVYVDANFRRDKKRNAELLTKYGNPLRLGLPALVVLDAKGRQLATQETQSLSDPTDLGVAKKIVAALAPWTSTGEEAGPESGPKKADESGTRASNAADTAGPTP